MGIRKSHEDAVMWLLKNVPSIKINEIKGAMEGYFSIPYNTLVTFKLYSDDYIDSIAWDIHEIVESLLWKRSGISTPKWDHTIGIFKVPFHITATDIENKFLISKGREKRAY